jgi:anti-anti-sigma regulatory factor
MASGPSISAAMKKEPTSHTGSALKLFFPDESLNLPFAVVNNPGHIVVITLAGNAGVHTAIQQPSSYKWIHGFRGKVVIDFSETGMMNSSLCNWLVNLMREAKPATVSIAKANTRVIETLRLLRLDALVSIEA